MKSTVEQATMDILFLITILITLTNLTKGSNENPNNSVTQTKDNHTIVKSTNEISTEKPHIIVPKKGVEIKNNEEITSKKDASDNKSTSQFKSFEHHSREGITNKPNNMSIKTDFKLKSNFTNNQNITKATTKKPELNSTKANIIIKNKKVTSTSLKLKKPTITFSMEDQPDSNKLNIEEPEQPIVQPSKEFEINEVSSSRTDYIIPVVALIFVIPIFMGAMIIFVRRIRDYWMTRHYRRMDFLVDGMYNE